MYFHAISRTYSTGWFGLNRHYIEISAGHLAVPWDESQCKKVIGVLKRANIFDELSIETNNRGEHVVKALLPKRVNIPSIFSTLLRVGAKLQEE